MTTGVWLVVRKVERSRLHALKQSLASALAHQVERKMANLEQALRGASGYLGRGPLPTRSEWRAYVERLDLPMAYPGVQGFSFVEWIPRPDLPDHLRRVRREGFPDYAVAPGGSAGPLLEGASTILYLEPMNAENQHAFGKDMLEDFTRRQAMLQARDTGQVVTSGPLVLYQDASGKPQPGVVLFGPVFREGQPVTTVAERRAALRGWATIPLRMDDFIRSVLSQFEPQAELSLFDSELSAGSQLYDSDPSHPVSGTATPWTLKIPGRTWVARIEPSPDFHRHVGHPRHWQFLLAGMVISLLVFTLLIFQTGAEARAKLLARLRGEELLASEAQFRALFERAPFGMAIVDSSSGRFLSVNPRFGDILGYSTEELLARDFQSITHPEHLQGELASVRDLASGAMPVIHKEMRYLHRSGQEIWARLSMAKLPSVSGAADRHLSVVEDIRERRRIEDSLRRSEANLSLAQEIGEFGSWQVVYQDGNESWSVSDGLRRLYGYRPDQPITLQTGFDIMHPEDREAVRSAWEAAMAGTGPSEWEHRIIVNGEVRWVAVRVLFQFNQDGRLQEASGIVQDITRRWATEEALRLSEARLRILGDQLPDSFLYQYLSRPGEAPRFLYLSAGVERLCGLKAGDVVQDPGLLFSQVDPTMLPAYLQAEAVSARDLSPFAMDLRQRHVDGRWRWFRVRSKPRPQPDGSVLWEGISTDITEAHEARLVLEESEARFRGLFELSPDPITLARLSDGALIEVNQAWCDLTGLTREEVLGRSTRELGPWARPEEREAFHRALRDSGGFGPEDILVKDRQGQLHQVVMSSRVLLIQGEQHYLSMSKDLSDRMEAERALKESEAKFRGVVEQATEAIYIHDEQGRLLMCNPEACRSTGFSQAELFGMRVQDLDLECSPDQDAGAWQTLKVGEQLTLQGRHRRKDGTSFPVEIRLGLLSPESPRQLLALVRDLTGQEQAIQADLRARKAESLVLMAGSIAHDFNNIFQGVLGFLEVAKLRAEQNPDVRQLLGRAEGSLRKAIGLSWKMLDFSGRALVKQDRLDLEAWLPAFAATLQLDLASTCLLEVSCEPTPYIMGDRLRLEEVLQALVANAREAAEPMPGRARLRLHTDFGADRPDSASPGIWPLPRPEFPATVCLEVSDEGPGVPAAILDRICDPFFTTHQLGRGLGLPSVMGILQAHRAGLHIFNGERGGLVIRMHFPPGGA
jgi:PAS domain S-box-containing protein